MKRLSVELKNVSLIFCQYSIRLFIWPVWKATLCTLSLVKFLLMLQHMIEVMTEAKKVKMIHNKSDQDTASAQVFNLKSFYTTGKKTFLLNKNFKSWHYRYKPTDVLQRQKKLFVLSYVLLSFSGTHPVTYVNLYGHFKVCLLIHAHKILFILKWYRKHSCDHLNMMLIMIYNLFFSSVVF